MFGHKIEGEVRGCKSTEHEKEHLDNIGVTNHLHSAEGDDDGKARQENHAKGKIQSGNCADCQGTQE